MVLVSLSVGLSASMAGAAAYAVLAGLPPEQCGLAIGVATACILLSLIGILSGPR